MYTLAMLPRFRKFCVLLVKDGHISDFRNCSNSAQIYITSKTDLSLTVSRDGSLNVFNKSTNYPCLY